MIFNAKYMKNENFQFSSYNQRRDKRSRKGTIIRMIRFDISSNNRRDWEEDWELELIFSAKRIVKISNSVQTIQRRIIRFLFSNWKIWTFQPEEMQKEIKKTIIRAISRVSCWGRGLLHRLPWYIWSRGRQGNSEPIRCLHALRYGLNRLKPPSTTSARPASEAVMDRAELSPPPEHHLHPTNTGGKGRKSF